MLRLPAGVVSHIYSFLPLAENVSLARTSVLMRKTSKLPTSSPKKLVWKSITGTTPAANIATDNKRVSSWRMWPTTVYADNLEHNILPWFSPYPITIGTTTAAASRLTHLALKVNSAEQFSVLLVPALKMLLKVGNDELTNNDSLRSLLIWPPLIAFDVESEEFYSDYQRQVSQFLDLLKQFTGLTTLGISGLSVAMATYFPPSVTHVFLDTEPKVGDGTTEGAILNGWKSLSQLPLQKLSLYLPRHQDHANCAGENCYSGSERGKLCEDCKLLAEANLYTLPNTNLYDNGIPTPPQSWTFDNNLAHCLALHFPKNSNVDSSEKNYGLIVEAYELKLDYVARQIPRLREFDCRSTSPDSLKNLTWNSGKQLQKLRLRGVRLRNSLNPFVNFDAFDDRSSMRWAWDCEQLTELIFTGQDVENGSVSELFRCLAHHRIQSSKAKLEALDLSGNRFIGLGHKPEISKTKTEVPDAFNALRGLSSLRIVSQSRAEEREFLNVHQFSELRIPTLTQLELRTGSKLSPAGFETLGEVLDAFPNLAVWRAPRVVALSKKFFAETTSTNSENSLTHLDLGLAAEISVEQLAEIVKIINGASLRLPLLTRLTLPAGVKPFEETHNPFKELTNQNGERIVVIRKPPLVKN